MLEVSEIVNTEALVRPTTAKLEAFYGTRQREFREFDADSFARDLCLLQKEIIIIHQPFGPATIKFYDEDLKRILDPSDLMRAQKIYVTNEDRVFGQPLHGILKGQFTAAIHEVPRFLTALSVYYPGGCYRFHSQYSLFEWSGDISAITPTKVTIF
jgi:hypothetical protein